MLCCCVVVFVFRENLSFHDVTLQQAKWSGHDGRSTFRYQILTIGSHCSPPSFHLSQTHATGLMVGQVYFLLSSSSGKYSRERMSHLPYSHSILCLQSSDMHLFGFLIAHILRQGCHSLLLHRLILQAAFHRIVFGFRMQV